jgi:hypothetical protein
MADGSMDWGGCALWARALCLTASASSELICIAGAGLGVGLTTRTALFSVISATGCPLAGCTNPPGEENAAGAEDTPARAFGREVELVVSEPLRWSAGSDSADVASSGTIFREGDLEPPLLVELGLLEAEPGLDAATAVTAAAVPTAAAAATGAAAGMALEPSTHAPTPGDGRYDNAAAAAASPETGPPPARELVVPGGVSPKLFRVVAPEAAASLVPLALAAAVLNRASCGVERAKGLTPSFPRPVLGCRVSGASAVDC